jgi:hypothetical protein
MKKYAFVLVLLLAGCGEKKEVEFDPQTGRPPRTPETVLVGTKWDFARGRCVTALAFTDKNFEQQWYCKNGDTTFAMAMTGEYRTNAQGELIQTVKRRTCDSLPAHRTGKFKLSGNLLTVQFGSSQVTLRPSFVRNPEPEVIRLGCIEKNGTFNEHPWADVR